jgi:hypothetical protein
MNRHLLKIYERLQKYCGIGILKMAKTQAKNRFNRGRRFSK